MSRIGFIGIGLMGSAIVQRLLAKGHKVQVLGSLSRSNVDAMLALGAQEAANAAELTKASEVVMICVGTSDQVEQRMFEANGVLQGIKPGTLVIDLGTSLPVSSLQIAADLTDRGAGFLDAAMGRTPAHAREGKLNLMVGGSDSDFARAQPLFADIAENIFHVGPVGAGQTLKLINNFYAMTTACAMAEAFVMADKAGLSRQKLYDVLAAGPNRSGMMDFIKTHAIDAQKSIEFTIGNAAKDIAYYARMAQSLGANSALSGATLAALAAARDDGWGKALVPEMVDYFAQQAGDEA